MSRLISVWAFVCRFKYLVVLALIAVVVGFVDENSYYERWIRWQRLDYYRKEIADFKLRYEHDAACLQELENNPEMVERMARERYYMCREGEDVFVIRTQDEEVTDIPTNAADSIAKAIL